MAAIFLVLASLAAFATGALLSWSLVRRRARREHAHLEAEMRGKIEERYRAYTALEKRVRAAMAGFDRRENDLRRRLANQSESILALRETLERHEGFDLARAESELASERSKETAFLGVPGGVESLVEIEDSIDDALAQMDDWERKVEGAALRSTAELERQSAELLAITRHVERLEPLTRPLVHREEELAGWKRKHAELERALSQQAALLQDCLRELAPVAAAVGEHELALREQREEYEARLEAGAAELEGSRARGAELEGSIEELRRDLEQAREELVLVGAERDSLDLRLAEEVGRVRELVPIAERAEELARRVDELGHELEAQREQLAAAETRLGERTKAYERQSAELERRLVAAEDDRVRLEQELGVAGERLLVLETELAEEKRRAQSAAETLQGELRSERERAGRLEHEREEALGRVRFHADALADKERLLAERERQVEDLTREVEDLHDTLSRTSQSLEGEKTRIGTLMRELGDVKERYQSRDSTLHEAQSVLDALRPMIQTLEQKLGRS